MDKDGKTSRLPNFRGAEGRKEGSKINRGSRVLLAALPRDPTSSQDLRRIDSPLGARFAPILADAAAAEPSITSEKVWPMVRLKQRYENI
jgi:hypothetical protein